jgi:hypothetical protein
VKNIICLQRQDCNVQVDIQGNEGKEEEKKPRESLLIDLLDWLLFYQIYLESLGPNLQSRLEALEAAMGVRLNVAKRQGRHSLSNSKYN